MKRENSKSENDKKERKTGNDRAERKLENDTQWTKKRVRRKDRKRMGDKGRNKRVEVTRTGNETVKENQRVKNTTERERKNTRT